MERTILIKIMYDGTGFCGWQRQPGRRSVQGEVERALSVVCRQEIRINGTSRTDAGVHALGQCATFSGDFGIPTERIPRAANHILSGGRSADRMGDVQILSAETVSAGFHARFDAKGKTYHYRICNTTEPDLFRRNYEYQVEKPLDADAMNEAAQLLRGTHDFKAFQASGGQPRITTVRTIYDISVRRCGDRVTISVTGDGFLYNMVRIISGTLVEVGSGRLEPQAMSGILAGCHRQNAGHTAPPQGLYLAEIYYDVIE